MFSLISTKLNSLALFSLIFFTQCGGGGSGSPADSPIDPLDLTSLRTNDTLTFLSIDNTTGFLQTLTLQIKSKNMATASLTVSGQSGTGHGINTAKTAPTTLHWSSTGINHTYKLSFKGSTISDGTGIELTAHIRFDVDATQLDPDTGQISIDGHITQIDSKVPNFTTAPFAIPYHQKDDVNLSITPRTAADLP